MIHQQPANDEIVKSREYRFPCSAIRKPSDAVSRFTHRQPSTARGCTSWSVDRCQARDFNPSIFGNDGRRLENAVHRYLTASPYDTVDVDCGPVVKHKTMAKFRDSLEIEDKIGFVHHSKPRKYGETKNNKVQRMVDKLERNYMIPSKSYWRNTPTQPIPELLIKPIGGKSVENQDQTGLERFKIDMRNPYSLEVLENIIPLPKDVNGKFGEYIEIPRQAHKTFASNIELAKIRKEEFQKNKIETIKKADLERMRLAQNCPPKYKKEIDSILFF